MATVHVRADTPVPPERIRAALTDFTDGRPDYWPNLDRSRYQVHATGESRAEVTEGAAFAGGIWERSRYDWSSPEVVRLEVIDSNAFRPGSSWEYRIRPDGHGGSHVELTVRRLPRTARGRLLAVLLTLFGRQIFRRDLAKTLSLLDADYRPTRAWPGPGFLLDRHRLHLQLGASPCALTSPPAASSPTTSCPTTPVLSASSASCRAAIR